MRIEINDSGKLASFWLCSAECEDDALTAALLPQYAAYKRQGYTVAVFRSGKEELLRGAEGLVLRNR